MENNSNRSSSTSCVSISGSGKIAGGSYDSVHVSGSGHATGDIVANSVRVSGSGHFLALSAREFRVSGSAQVKGSLDCDEMQVSGFSHFHDTVQAEQMRVSGCVKIGDSTLRGVNGRVSGALRAEGDVEFEQIVLSGAASIRGLLNAENVHIILNGISEIGEIGGDTIVVEKGQHGAGLVGRLCQLFGAQKHPCALTCDSIEGTNIRLARTKCRIVRGETVVIGPDCRIEQVEYAQTLTIDESSEVLHQKQI